MSEMLKRLNQIENPAKVPVDPRHWEALKRAVWRSKQFWEIALREATEIVRGCAHMTGCAAESSETEPCLPDCPDRERRMSALVILNAAREFAPGNVAPAAEGPYFAPTREHFSSVLAELAACQVEIEKLKEPKT